MKMMGHLTISQSRSERVKVLREIFVYRFQEQSQWQENQWTRRELCITRFVLFFYVIVISPRTVNLSMGRWCYPSPPSPPISTREPFLFGRAQKRAPEWTELSYRKECTSRQTGLISFLLLILLLLYFYILLGYLLPSTCHPNEALFEKAKNS